MFRRHEEIARLWRVVRRLLGNVVTAGSIRVVPVAGEDLAQDWVQRFLDASVSHQLVLVGGVVICVRWFDVPATQVELGHCYESLDGVFDLRHGQQGLWMGHEAAGQSASGSTEGATLSGRTLLSFQAWTVVLG